MSIDFTEAEVRALAVMRCRGVCRVFGGWECGVDSDTPKPIFIPDPIMARLVVRGLAEVLEDDIGVFAQLTTAGDDLMCSALS